MAKLTSAELRGHALALLEGTGATMSSEELAESNILEPDEVTKALIALGKDGLAVKCVKLALAGYTHQQIADQLHISARGVHVYIRRVFLRQAAVAGVDEYRGKELARIETITRRMWPLLDPDDPDAMPSLAAIDRFVSLSKARRELLGLDRPKQVEVDVNVSGAVEHTEKRTKDLSKFMDWADRIVQQNIGSGRVPEVIEGETVDEEDE